MKKLIALSVIIVLLITSTPVLAGGLASSSGADLFRGAWGGTLTIRTAPPPGGEVLNVQLNVYFNESVPGDTPGSFKASGYSSITWEEPDKPKRAKAELLPMMAKYTDTGDGTFGVTILATFPTPPWAPVVAKVIYKLTGTANMSGSGVHDDVMSGTWVVRRPDGTIGRGEWSLAHLDRRNVGAPEVSLKDPTLYFITDTVAHLFGPAGPPESRNPRTWAQTYSNIVMDSVRVTFPDGTVKILPPYTDVYTPDVDWVTEFRFAAMYLGLPVAGGTYTFDALDVAGNPIPGVQNTDIWLGPPTVPPPDPPIHTLASLVAAPKPGIFVTWDAVTPVPGSFEPPTIGDYRIEVCDHSNNVLVYAATGIGSGPLSHLVPRLKADFISGMDRGASLEEFATGRTYRLMVLARSLAPVGSAGKGAEYNVRWSRQYWFFEILAGGSVINLRKAS